VAPKVGAGKSYDKRKKMPAENLSVIQSRERPSFTGDGAGVLGMGRVLFAEKSTPKSRVKFQRNAEWQRSQRKSRRVALIHPLPSPLQTQHLCVSFDINIDTGKVISLSKNGQ
jgi:hypothetical protein